MRSRTVVPLSLTRRGYKGIELKTDGYYYAFDRSSQPQGGVFINLFALYKNAVFLYLGSPELEDLSKTDIYMKKQGI